MDLSELQALRIQELAEMAKSLKISDDISSLNKQELTVKILEAQAEKDGSVFAKGILEVMHDGYGFLRSPDFNYMPGPDDIYVSPSQIILKDELNKIGVFRASVNFHSDVKANISIKIDKIQTK